MIKLYKLGESVYMKDDNYIIKIIDLYGNLNVRSCDYRINKGSMTNEFEGEIKFNIRHDFNRRDSFIYPCHQMIFFHKAGQDTIYYIYNNRIYDCGWTGFKRYRESRVVANKYKDYKTMVLTNKSLVI